MSSSSTVPAAPTPPVVSASLPAEPAGWWQALRTAAVFGAVAPSLGAGLAVYAATGNRRRAIDCTTSLFGDLATAAAGLEPVIEGSSHLEQAGPCVVTFNHQSDIDFLLVCAVLRRNFAGVAKQELKHHPVFGPAFRFADTVFIDRSNRGQAAAALAPAVAALAAGTSIVIFPEGTRSESGALGPFKKGAFHIAMQARVPMLPIVIHDAARLMPKGAWFARPGPVRVQVLPAVATDDWTADSLDQHVEFVHSLYRQTLTPRGPASD
jgi:putative phosphoserine phosphatase/1-acylglycerol-3-phosphate O-acyltransferase